MARNALKRSVLTVGIFWPKIFFGKNLVLELWPKCSRPIRSLGFSKVNISRTARPFLIIFGMVKGIHERNALFFGKKSICPNLGLKGLKWARLDRKFEFGRIWSCYIPLDCKCHADCRFWKTFVKFAVLGYF